MTGQPFVPMLCERDTTSARILEDARFLFELKLDGVRIIADRTADRVTLTYRSGRDATKIYGEVADAVRALAERRLVLDGEIVAFDDQGRPDFERLGQRIQRANVRVPVSYVVFDLLAMGDRDLRGLPIEERKRLLETVLPKEPGYLRLHPTFEVGGVLLDFCRQHRLEGVVAKRRGSRYRAGERTTDWVKVKCELDADLVVIGWTEGTGQRGALGALDLGVYENGELVARGSVGSGLDGDTIAALTKRLRALEIPRSAAKGRLAPKRGRRFVKPEIVVSVRYTGITGEGLLRHPVFRGIREDLRPEDVEGPHHWAAPGAAR